MEIGYIFGIVVLSFVLGALCLLVCVIVKMLGNDAWRNPKWDNALRVLSQVIRHPDELGELYRIPPTSFPESWKALISIRKPFWYINTWWPDVNAEAEKDTELEQ